MDYRGEVVFAGPVLNGTVKTEVKFTVGDRVVVSERYRGAGCNHGAIGYYGHVAAIEESGDFYGPWIKVAFRGHINGPAAKGYDRYMQNNDDRPFPCYAFELDHAD